jgi:hypothetical protein
MTCDHCADVIGVHEPVVVVTDDEARGTSRAAEPAICAAPGKGYHRACHALNMRSAHLRRRLLGLP